jgi:hypothetical protein
MRSIGNNRLARLYSFGPESSLVCRPILLLICQTYLAQSLAGRVPRWQIAPKWQSGKEGQHTYTDVFQIARQNDRRFSDLNTSVWYNLYRRGAKHSVIKVVHAE